ncbi:hypothetical protein LCGC14_2023510 [marine sediment metagenome]|uniref:Uncharacterized protein n=1 Tax=marine sediment metagenome TaxID=412755 RepID=A0A0F9EWU6_9ZZZZ
MSEEVKLSPNEEAQKVETQFKQVVVQRDKLVKQRSEIDRALNEVGQTLLRLQGAYEMAMRILGKDVAGNELVVPPSPKKEIKEVIPSTKKKKK